MRREEYAFLGEFFRQVSARPLDPEDRRYVPLYQDPELVRFDPVDALARAISWTRGESVQLLSGFRGTGKSTELRRLKQRLEASHYIVLLCDMEQYLNLSTPLDVTDFVLAICGAVNEELSRRGLLEDGLKQSWGDRLTRLFDGKVEISELKAGALGVSASIKTSLKTDPDFKKLVQQRMAGHLGTLMSEVYDYFEMCTNAIRRRKSISVELVLLLDSIEHIRGTTVNAHQVQSSVENLFVSHADKLHFPGWHVIYTVPPHLKVSYGNLGSLYEPGGVKVLPAFKLRDQAGTRIERNYRVIEQVVAARGDWRRLLADRAALDRLICASGGHLRDLLRLVAGVLTLAQGTPVPASTVDAAIDQLRTEFLPIADDEALWLAEISRTHQIALSSADRLPVLAQVLDTHLALCYRNGDEWYDIHPLIADQVKAQVRVIQERSGR